MPCRHALHRIVGQASAGLVLPLLVCARIRIETPDFPAAYRIEGNGKMVGRTQIEHIIHHDRRNFIGRLFWIGIAAPAGTPAAILDKLNAEMVRILNEPDVKERLAALAFTPVPGSRSAFGAYIRSEIDKWGKAVKASGARVD